MSSVKDIGALSGKVLVFGGPYSNLQALKALQAVCADLGIAADQVICTGDIVAYCGEPEETVSAIREWGIPVVMGNCEESLGNEADDCGCGFEEGSACSLLSVSWYRYSAAQLSSDSRHWMRGLPRRVRFRLGGKQFACLHGSADSINQFVFSSTDQAFKQAQLAALGVDVIIGGHSGIPFGEQLPNGVWLNAGVIGMPANDGESSTWYMVLEETRTGVRVAWHRLVYPVSGAQQAMEDAGLPDGYREALATGLWPSLDVLPETERQQTGRALKPAALTL